MKKCLRCGSLLPDDATVCTTCNLENPFDIEKKKTAYDLTMAFDPMADSQDLYRVKSRKKLLVYAWLLGFTGFPYIYLGYKKKALISLIVSLLFIIALTVISSLLISPSALVIVLCALASIVLCNSFYGIFFLSHSSLKDSFGEYLR